MAHEHPLAVVFYTGTAMPIIGKKMGGSGNIGVVWWGW